MTDGYFHEEREKIRIVGNGIGFWKSMGEEDQVYDSSGDVFAFKTYFTYFSGSPHNAMKTKKTIWRMEEYRLPMGCSTKGQEVTNLPLHSISSP
ncbi:unnamed protein product [Ilex paraguariensis]|uniref:NAC domain-containing protein n=1 Tax=Ilex paraguariensis TaxID=185542 RepID=A0ABC8S100_9AQUA